MNYKTAAAENAAAVFYIIGKFFALPNYDSGVKSIILINSYLCTLKIEHDNISLMLKSIGVGT